MEGKAIQRVISMGAMGAMAFKIHIQDTEGDQPIYMASGPNKDALALLAAIKPFTTTEIRAVGTELKTVITLRQEHAESKGRMPELEQPIQPPINAAPVAPIAPHLDKVAIEERKYNPESDGDSTDLPCYEEDPPTQPTVLEVLANNSKEEAARIIEEMIEIAKLKAQAQAPLAGETGNQPPYCN